ncbi:MAG: DUF459 domain-containing protein [Pseudomonadota bacterium]
MTPVKVVFIYFLTFALVCVHEIDRIVGWVENICLDWAAAPMVLDYCRDVRTAAEFLGLDLIIDEENKFISRTITRPAAEFFDRKGERRVARGLVQAETVPGAPPSGATTPGAGPAPPGEQEKLNRLSRPIIPPPSLPPEEAPPEKPILSPETPAAPPVSPPPTGGKPEKKKIKTVLIVGDSMILEGFGPALQRELSRREGLEVIREGRHSTGLSRPDYFDWPPHLEEILDLNQPDLLVISLGANDAQDILDENRKRHFVGTEGWNRIYAERAGLLLKAARDRGVLTFWVGLPIMGLEKYAAMIAGMNALVETTCREFDNCHFLDSWNVLADENGAYSNFLRNPAGEHVRVRAKDKIHLTPDGGRLMVDYFMKNAEAVADLSGFAEAEADPGTAAGPVLDAAAGTAARPAGAPPSAVAPAPRSEKAAVQLKSLFSQARGKMTQYYVYTPQTSPNGPADFPVLYLLHGAWDDYRAWEARAGDLLAELSGKLGLIIVLPDGDPFGWYADSPFDKNNMIETYLIKELIPAVEGGRPVQAGRRGIEGLSMGGHGAMVLALRNPGTFISAGSMSGVLDITRHPRQWELRRVFGPFGEENLGLWRDHSALFLSRNRREELKKLQIMVAVSTGDDWTLEDNRLFHQELEGQGIAHEYFEGPGTHDWAFWKRRLPLHLTFHAKALRARGGERPVIPAAEPRD